MATVMPSWNKILAKKEIYKENTALLETIHKFYSIEIIRLQHNLIDDIC